VGGDTSTTAASGADPKDKILEFRHANQGMRDGILALNRHEYASAARTFEELLGSGIESWLAYVIALIFLLFRPQGLFGERIIERI